MICPVCKKHNVPDTDICAQCGSDIRVHQLLGIAREDLRMKEAKSEYTAHKNLTKIAFKIAPTIILLIGIFFIIFVGMRVLAFLDRLELQRSSVSSKWSETGFEQLQQMNSIIKQELDFIVDQRHENQELQAEVQKLNLRIIESQVQIMPAHNVHKGQ